MRGERAAGSRKGQRDLHRRDLVTLLNGSRDRLSPVQRQLADYVLRNYREVGFMGVAELARQAQVSPAGVHRFATALKFDGYPQFQDAIQAIIRTELRQGERFEAAIKSGSGRPVWDRVLAQEADNMALLRVRLDRRSVERAVRMVVRADSLVVVGFRHTATLARYLWYNLRKVRDNVSYLGDPGSVTLDDVALAGRAGATFVFIAFPRYSSELLAVAELARRSKFRSLGVTNNEMSPLIPFCDHVICAEVTEISFTDFFAAPVTLLNALVAEVAARLERKALDRLNMLDDLAVEQGYLFQQQRRVSARPATQAVRERGGGDEGK